MPTILNNEKDNKHPCDCFSALYTPDEMKLIKMGYDLGHAVGLKDGVLGPREKPSDEDND